VGLLSTDSGEIYAQKNTFILDEKLLDQIKIIDRYSEQEEGQPAVKIVGEIREIGKIIEKPKQIFDEDVYEAFLTENFITSGYEYIRAICQFNTQYYPIFYFLNARTPDSSDAFKTVERIKTRSGIRKAILERIRTNDSHLRSKSECYPFASTVLGRLRKRYYTELVSVHPEIGKFGRDQGVGENLTAGIWLIFRGLNFSRKVDIGQIVHLWMGTS
jgi:hypothetical protein